MTAIIIHWFSWHLKCKRTASKPIWKSNFLLSFFTATAVAPNHPYTCGIDEKLSKMVGYLVSYSVKSSWTEIFVSTICNGGKLCWSSSIHSWVINPWIIELCISKYLSLCVNGWFFKIQSHGIIIDKIDNSSKYKSNSVWRKIW